MIGVIIFMSFFVRFLVFELLSILYFTKVNSDLGLGRLVGKQRSLVLQNMPLMLTCGAWGWSPRFILRNKMLRTFCHTACFTRMTIAPSCYHGISQKQS